MAVPGTLISWFDSVVMVLRLMLMLHSESRVSPLTNNRDLLTLYIFRIFFVSIITYRSLYHREPVPQIEIPKFSRAELICPPALIPSPTATSSP